jgi:hypothetical protein
LQAFFTELGDRKHTIRAVSIDVSGGYEKAIRESIPDAEAAFDPFHFPKVNSGCYALEDPALAPAHLDAWLAWASRSRLEPFVKLARTIRRHQAGILAAIRRGLPNGRLIRPQQPHPPEQPPQLWLPLRPAPSSRSSTCAARASPSIYRDEPSPTNRPEHPTIGELSAARPTSWSSVSSPRFGHSEAREGLTATGR